MNFSIYEAGHIKARVITTFAKIGDSIYLDARKDCLKFITFNLSKTACAECIFTKSFFSNYEVDDNVLRAKKKDSITCKVFIKNILSFFKGHIEKKLKNLKISFKPDNDFITIDMVYSRYIRMLNTVKLMEFETLNVAIQPNCGKNNIYGNSKNMTQILSVFCPTDKELTMELLNSKLVVRNYRVGTPRARGMMRCQVTLHTHEFSLYDIREELTMTFVFKPFKILTHFAEIFGLPFRLNYMEEGKPITVSTTDPTFEVNFILSTLCADQSTPPMTVETANLSRAAMKTYAAKVIRPLGERPISGVFISATQTTAASNSVVDEPMDTRQEDVDSQEIQIGTQARGMDSQERQIGTQERGMDSQERQIGTHGRGIDSQERQIGTQGRGMDSQERQIGTQGSGMDSQERQTSTQGRGMDTQERQIGTQGRGMNSREIRIRTQERGMDSQERQMGTQEKDIDTQERLIKKPRTSFDIWIDKLVGNQNGNGEQPQFTPKKFEASTKNSKGSQKKMDLSREINFGTQSTPRIKIKENAPSVPRSENSKVRVSRFVSETDMFATPDSDLAPASNKSSSKSIYTPKTSFECVCSQPKIGMSRTFGTEVDTNLNSISHNITNISSFVSGSFGDSL